MNTLKTILKKASLAASALLAAATASAQTSGASFLNVTPSARSYALGMSNVVSALGASAVGANPANLGLMTQKFEAFSSYASLMEGTQYGHLSAAYALSSHPLGLDALGASLTRLQTAGIEGYDSSGNKTGASLGSGSTAMALSGAATVAPQLRLGLTGKAIKSQIAGYQSNTALAADLGLTYTETSFRKPISIGASLTNMGNGIRFLEQTDPLPMSANIGAAVPVGPVMAVLELNRLVRDGKTEFGMGLEYGLGPVSFRAGYIAQSQANNLALKDQAGAARLLGGLSGGLGVSVGPARLDYAISQQAVEFGATQRVALTVLWGSRSEHATPASDDWKSHPDRSDWLLRSMGNY